MVAPRLVPVLGGLRQVTSGGRDGNIRKHPAEWPNSLPKGGSRMSKCRQQSRENKLRATLSRPMRPALPAPRGKQVAAAMEKGAKASEAAFDLTSPEACDLRRFHERSLASPPQHYPSTATTHLTHHPSHEHRSALRSLTSASPLLTPPPRLSPFCAPMIATRDILRRRNIASR